MVSNYNKNGRQIVNVVFILGMVLLNSCKIDNEQKVFFYQRGELGYNKDISYQDYLNIYNYHSHPRTAKELYDIARNYLDTVNVTHAISSVEIMAKDVTQAAPRPNLNSNITDRKYCIIGFGFKQAEDKGTKDPDTLVLITLWKDGVAAFYYRHFFEKPVREKNLLDSILSSSIAIHSSD